MPICQWCGARSAVTEYDNGPTVIRLCPKCSESEEAQGLTVKMGQVLDFELKGDVWEEEAPRPMAWWVKATALLVLVAFLAPIALAVMSRF